MSRVEEGDSTREPRPIDINDKDEYCPDPLVEFCKRHPRYDRLDKFLNTYFLIFVMATVMFAILVGLAIRWVIL